MFLHAVSTTIDILVEHFNSIDLAKVANKRHNAFKMGWKEPDFLYTSVRDLQTRRAIINPERFLYSRANPNPIEDENRLHAEMEGGYIVMLRDSMSATLRAAMEDRLNFHRECLENNKIQKKS